MTVDTDLDISNFEEREMEVRLSNKAFCFPNAPVRTSDVVLQ